MNEINIVNEISWVTKNNKIISSSKKRLWNKFPRNPAVDQHNKKNTFFCYFFPHKNKILIIIFKGIQTWHMFGHMFVECGEITLMLSQQELSGTEGK